jgi:hypothetical protein
MNNQKKEWNKVLSITLLFIISAIIILLGVLFSILSLIYNINLMVLNNQVNGMVFGVVICYLGIRYFLSVNKLKTEVYKSTSKFSWGNFKKISMR